MLKAKLLVNSLMACAISFFVINSASAEYLFTAPPRESAKQGKALYGQLAEELSRIMQAEVKYVHPGNWIAYKKKVKSGKYDFIFDGPHFAAWRLQNLDVNPLVKLPGALSFVLVADKENTMIRDKDSLISRKICVLPSPHLGTLSAYSMYPNQVRQPRFVSSSGGFKNLMVKYKSGKCDAIILREDYFKNKLDEDTRNRLRVIAKSKEMTNQSITVSSRISQHKRQQISAFLTSNAGRAAAQPLLNRFSKKRPNFITAKADDYVGHNLLSDNMIFGW